MLQLPKLATPVRLRSPAPFFNFIWCFTMKKFSVLILFAGLFLFSGCRSTDNRMSSEDIEVPKKYHDIIAILKDNRLSSNSREKYEAVKDLLEVVDLSYTRELKTVNELFYHGDARLVPASSSNGTDEYLFNFQYKNNYVRLRFVAYKMCVLKVVIEQK